MLSRVSILQYVYVAWFFMYWRNFWLLTNFQIYYINILLKQLNSLQDFFLVYCFSENRLHTVMVFIFFTEVDPVQNGWCRSTCLLRKDTQIIPMARHMPCQDSLPSAYMKVLDTLLVRTFIYDVIWHRGIKESGVKLTSPASNRISLLGFCMWFSISLIYQD